MSEYADLRIGNLSLFSFRNYLDESIVGLLFSRADLLQIQNCKADPDDEDSCDFTRYMYKTTVLKASERLDALGYGVSRFEELFDSHCLEAVDFYSFFQQRLHIDYEACETKAKERVNKISFKKWKNSIEKIIKYELTNGCIRWNPASNEKSIGISTECDKIIYYSLKDIESSYFYAIDTEIIPVGCVVRLILDCCDPEKEIEIDFSNLAYWDDDCIPRALNATDDVEKTIVLVEGTSDKDILEFALKHLYPHVSDLFYFMDFEDGHGGKRAGGTSDEVKNLKTFYYSKIKSKFIAVFDNDAEGYSSKCTLLNEVKKWPDNFRILLYPDIDFFDTYPTLSPSGKVEKDNIMRKACSIELYLPDSIIKDENGYYPIEWEARKKVKTETGSEEYLYQGVISQKDVIKARFHELRRSIESGKTPFVQEDWSRMKLLIASIVFAFV